MEQFLKTVLVIEDCPSIQKIMVFTIKKEGYHVLLADNGVEGLQLIQDKKPDLVFLDLGLPLMNGLTVCYRVKKDDALKDIPIILATGSDEDLSEDALIKIRADDFLRKPFGIEDLKKKMDKYLQ